MAKGKLRSSGSESMLLGGIHDTNAVDEDDSESAVAEEGRDLLDSCYEDIAFARYLVNKVGHEATARILM